jgi:hypothetical protein
MRTVVAFAKTAATLLALAGLTACGKQGSVTLVAKNSDPAFSKPVIDTLKVSGPSTTSGSPAPFSTSPFKICIKKVSLEDESGEDRGNGSSEGETEEEENEIEFSVGEVDLSTLGSSDVTLGTIPDAPVGFKISKVKIKIKKFGTCEHSIEYETKTTNADVEFRFRFNPAVELNSGDTLDLYFSQIASVISGTDEIDNGSFRSAIQQVQATARKRD